MNEVVVLGGTFLSGAKTFASVHRLASTFALFPKRSTSSNLRSYSFTASYNMRGRETVRALRLLSRGSAGLLSGPEQVTVWIHLSARFPRSGLAT